MTEGGPVNFDQFKASYAQVMRDFIMYFHEEFMEEAESGLTDLQKELF